MNKEELDHETTQIIARARWHHDVGTASADTASAQGVSLAPRPGSSAPTNGPIVEPPLAANPRFGGGPTCLYDGGFLYRAPQPGQSLPGATSRPTNRDMQRMPSMGGRSGMTCGGDRMNGGMRRR
jgi:hypothetical protein